ncbi:MAG TPA: pyridoxal phosphate-dependent aminotransferase [Kiloniellales bacterium]|jgi:aspartate aminotransferase|nr:pyridoxal phosphate-dependent aminotransferase [Kiloniellales bacterium]
MVSAPLKSKLIPSLPEEPPLPLRPEVEALGVSGIQQVWEMGFQKPDVIGLWVGEGDVPTPSFISDAAIASLRAGNTYYTHKRGIPPLREALAQYHARLLGIAPDPERISVTSSGMAALTLIFQAVVAQGDEVILVSPIWPNAAAAVQIAGGRPVEVSLDSQADGSFELDIDKLTAAIGPRTRALFIASPGNPTGWMMEQEQQREILALARERGLWLIADEVYHRFTYDRPWAPSFASIAEPEDALICVHSFSKAWAMTGWRLGWLLHPPSMGETFGKLIEYSSSGAQHFLQDGAVAAIRDGEAFVTELVERCREGGDIVFDALSDCPRVRIARPKAAFYAFFGVEGMTDSLTFAKQLVLEAGVGLAPGAAFGAGGEGFLRLCFASSPQRIAQAMERLRPALL